VWLLRGLLSLLLLPLQLVFALPQAALQPALALVELLFPLLLLKVQQVGTVLLLRQEYRQQDGRERLSVQPGVRLL
jgi:hypothetical protein